MHELALFSHLPPALTFECWESTRVRQSLDVDDLEITSSRDMHLGVTCRQIGSTKVTVQGDGTVDFWVLPDCFTGREIRQTIGKEIRVLVPEDQRTELHDANEATEQVDFSVRVATVDDTREMEELGTLVDFCPETMLQPLLGVLECLLLLDEVEVSQKTNDFGETVRLKNVEKLECFLIVSKTLVLAHHLESKTSINHEQNQVGDLANVNHGVEIVVALDECQTTGLAADTGDGSANVIQVVLGEALDERLHQRSLSNLAVNILS